MRVHGAVLLAFILLPVAAAPALACCHGQILDVGGGVLAGGYFGELKHDWDLGMGGSLFIQTPLCCDFEARLRGSMLWNDGTGRLLSSGDGPDLGAQPGERSRTFRRSSYELSLLWRMEGCSNGNFAVPYLGTGLSAYDWRVELQSQPAEGLAGGLSPVIRPHNGWDWGFHGIAGMRFYRTSGLFVAFEGTVHAIDMTDDWASGYDLSLLLGMELNR